MADKPGFLHRLLTGFWTLIDQARRSIVNILFLLIIYALIKGLFFAETPTVPSGAALVIKPLGFVVDELDYVEPIDEALDELTDNSEKVPQTLLSDLLTAIDKGRQDESINALLLDLRSFYGAGPSKLQDIALAIQSFKTSGKPVYAYSAFYNQSQYYVAAQADEVYVDPLGNVFIEGYGRFNTYFKEALDKLGINYHIFKVGTYKSAVEPFIRNDMSDHAKEANRQYLDDLWQSYTENVAKARDLTADDIHQYSDNMLEELSQVKTTTADLALKASLVDGIKTREEIIDYLTEKVGENKKGDNFKQISHKKYLEIVQGSKVLAKAAESTLSSVDKVAIIVAKGVILDGNQKAGAIGGDSTAKLIRRARNDKSVKALVLRVDSPGGSAYASEIIRRELVKFQESGKPVVVSMGSYAASGGYWISATADEIWASPTTITGSIGIFGMIPTFEKPLNDLGIHRDGVGTTRLSGAFDFGKPLRDDVGKAIQNSIENGYNQFITIVANGRNMTKTAVNEIAQGRVWSGARALEIGLVDQLGGLDEAVESAAIRANLVGHKTKLFEQELSEGEQFFKQLFDSSLYTSLRSGNSEQAVSATQYQQLSPAVVLVKQLEQSFNSIVQMNDPQNMYVHCLCTVR